MDIMQPLHPSRDWDIFTCPNFYNNTTQQKQSPCHKGEPCLWALLQKVKVKLLELILMYCHLIRYIKIQFFQHVI